MTSVTRLAKSCMERFCSNFLRLDLVISWTVKRSRAWPSENIFSKKLLKRSSVPWNPCIRIRPECRGENWRFAGQFRNWKAGQVVFLQWNRWLLASRWPGSVRASDSLRFPRLCFCLARIVRVRLPAIFCRLLLWGRQGQEVHWGKDPVYSVSKCSWIREEFYSASTVR